MIFAYSLRRVAIWVLPVAILAVTFSVWQRGGSGRLLTGQAAQKGFCCLDGMDACQPGIFDTCAANAGFEAFDTSEDICNAQCGNGTVMYCQNRADVIAGKATAVCSPQLVQGEFAFVGQDSCETVCGANTCADCATCNGAAGEGIACGKLFCEMNPSCLWNAGAVSCGQKAAVCGGAASSASSSAPACSGGSPAVSMCAWESEIMGGDPKITGPDGNTWVSHGQTLLKWPPGTWNYDYLPYQATDFALGSDGNVWFTDGRHNSIGRIDQNSVITLFPIPTVAHDGTSYPWHLTLGPDGNIWFTELWAGRIGKITPAGVITEYPVMSLSWDGLMHPTPVMGIIGGKGCELWFTVNGWKKHIGKITVDGVVTIYTIPDNSGTINPIDINLAANGDVLFTDSAGYQRFRVYTFFPATGTFDLVGTELSGPRGICPASASSAAPRVTPSCTPGIFLCNEISCPASQCGDTSVSDGRGMCRCGADCATCPEDPSCVDTPGDKDPYCAAGSSSSGSGNSSSARSSSSSRSSSASSVAVVCGNGLIQAREVCDDGNVVDGDGCSRLCVIEDGFICNP